SAGTRFFNAAGPGLGAESLAARSLAARAWGTDSFLFPPRAPPTLATDVGRPSSGCFRTSLRPPRSSSERPRPRPFAATIFAYASSNAGVKAPPSTHFADVDPG